MINIRIMITKFTSILVLLLLLYGCSSLRPSAYPRSIEETSTVNLNISDTRVEEQLELAYLNWRGTAYGYGQQQPRVAADCSGFTQRVFKEQLAINIPRTTQQQIQLGRKIKLKNANPGDLVFFDLKNGYRHVGIYLGNNIVMQATSSKGVTKTNLDKEAWWAKKVFMVKRIIQN